MGLGPVLSATELLKRNELTLADIETWELNEAFATQVLGCLAAWNDEKFCKRDSRPRRRRRARSTRPS